MYLRELSPAQSNRAEPLNTGKYFTSFPLYGCDIGHLDEYCLNAEDNTLCPVTNLSTVL